MEKPYLTINQLMEAYFNDELPADQLVFSYYASPLHLAQGKHAIIHRDELKKYAQISRAYPDMFNERQ